MKAGSTVASSVARPAVEHGEPVAVKRRQPIVQRVSEHAERRLGLELRRTPGQHKPAARPAQRRQLFKQPTLADARLPGHLEHQRALGCAQCVQQVHEHLPLTVSANQHTDFW